MGIDGRQQLRAHAAGRQDMAQVARQPVADVQHGVQGEVLRQPARLGQARLEFEMLAGQRAAQFAGDEDRVARFRAGAQHALAARHPAEQRDRDEDAAGVGGGFAADDGHLVPPRQRVQAGVNRLHKLGLEVARQADRHQRRGRRPRHGRNVAQAPAQRLVADLLRRRRRP